VLQQHPQRDHAHARPRPHDLHDHDSAAALEDAVVLAEGALEVRDVPQGVAHAQHVELPVPERQRLSDPLHQTARDHLPALGEHPRARVESDHAAHVSEDGYGLTRHEPCPRRDVEQAHSGDQAGPRQDLPPVA
jgi:hypothetical protein